MRVGFVGSNDVVAARVCRKEGEMRSRETWVTLRGGRAGIVDNTRCL